MTLDEFLEKLRATPRTWTMAEKTPNGWVTQDRTVEGEPEALCMCPLTSVALDVLGPKGTLTGAGPVTADEGLWLFAGVQMGLNAVACTEIAVAADGGWGHGLAHGGPRGYDTALRAKILDACGLEETR